MYISLTKQISIIVMIYAAFLQFGCTLQVNTGSAGLGGGSSASAVSTVLSITVTAAYPNNGVNWNDYVKNDGATIYAGTDTACVGNETPYTACLHAGEMRKVVITGVSACTGLSMTDSLGAFDWTCSASSGTATFYSSLKSTKGLRDLLTVAGWSQNSVTLSGSQTASSSSTTWWTNTITALPDNSVGGAGVVLFSGQCK
jgi:hypothetical protein